MRREDPNGAGFRGAPRVGERRRAGKRSLGAPQAAGTGANVGGLASGSERRAPTLAPVPLGAVQLGTRSGVRILVYETWGAVEKKG